MKGLYFVIPVWGERDISRWLHYGLPTLFAPGNLPALAKAHTVKALLCTTQEDIPRLFGAPAVKALREMVAVRAIPIADTSSAIAKTRDTLNRCYNQGLATAAQDDYGLIAGLADFVYADGALEEIGRQIAAGKRAALTHCPSVIAEDFGDLLTAAGITPSDASLIIPPRTLVRIMRQGLHAISGSQTWGTDRFSFNPSALYWRVGDDGFLVRAWHLHPAFLYPDRQAKVTTTIDSTFLDEALSDLGACAILDDSDRYLAVALSDRGQADFIPTQPRQADPVEIATWLPRNTKPFNRDLIRHKLRLHERIDRPAWHEIETVSDQAISAILDRFTRSDASLGFLKSVVTKLNQGLIDANSSPWWQQCQANVLTCIRDAATPRELIFRIQENFVSGFDHRVERNACDDVETLSAYKWRLLCRMFPGFERAIGAFEESLHALPSSIVEISGRRLSNILLSHLEFFLFVRKFYRPKTILEIGGGYGSLARIFCELSGPLTYVIVDMPTSLLCAYIYLREALPDAEIELAPNLDSIDLSDVSRSRIVLVPTPQATKQSFARFAFDFAINTGSFQEMPADTCRRFQNLIFEELKVPLVYSNNYFLNANEVGSERERNQAEMPMVPNFPPEYRVASAVINNPVFDIDASERNWLEVLLTCEPGPSSISTSIDEHRVCKAIEAICRKDALGILSYLRAYKFITQFYFGKAVTAPFGWGDAIQSNLFGMPFAFPNDISDPAEVRSWLNQQLAEIGAMRRRLNLRSPDAEALVEKMETRLVAKGLDCYKAVATKRIKRSGLPSITAARLAAFRQVMDLAETDGPFTSLAPESPSPASGE